MFLRSAVKCLFVAILLGNAPQTNVAAADSGEEGWTSLFDGETLDGWERHSGTAEFHVEDGAIVGTAVLNTGNTFLCTTREFGDFIFECEFKVDEGLNSGVQFRSEVFDAAREVDLGEGTTRKVPAGRVHGYQCEIDSGDKPSRMWTGGIYDEARRGWLFPGAKGGDGETFTEQGVRLVDRDGWNTFRIECRGDSIKTYLNGELRADFTDDLTPKGFIALQVHGIGNRPERAGTQVHMRRVRIRELIDK